MGYEIGKITSEYSDQLKKQFEGSGGKLFIVDYSKSCALQAVKEILAEKDSYRSLICVVDDREVATEFATILESTVGKITVVDTFSKLEKCLSSVLNGEKLTATADLSGLGARFKKEYPNLIITAKDEDTGEVLFNRFLCKDASKNGVYDAKDEIGYFCVSDILAVFRYEFVVIDNVYGRFAFEEENKEEEKEYPHGRYERIDFLGKAYYTEYTHSFKRLNNLVDASKKSIVLSDVVVDANAVNLYLALELLYGKFPMFETRDLVLKATSNYIEDCEIVCGEIFNYNNESYLARCLQRLVGSKQTIPGDAEKMSAYIAKQFNYMSEEEIFLRIVDFFARTTFKGNYTSAMQISERFQRDPNQMINCLCDLFFADEIKGELESVLTNAHVRKMSEEQISDMFEVFLRYGVYHPYPQDANRCKVVRLKRDDSAYERYARGWAEIRKEEKEKEIAQNGVATNRPYDNYAQERTDDEFSYSVLHDGSTLYYKCMAIKSLLADNPKKGFGSPLLIVTRSNGGKIRETLSKLLPNYKCSLNINDLTKDDTVEKIVIIDYDLFRETALWLHIRSAVFFDLEYDAVVLKNLINKALRYSDSTTAYLFADYGDLSGAIADAWQDELLSPNQKAMPIDNSEIVVKGGVERIYADVIRELEEVYCLLSDIVSKGKQKYLLPCAEKFNHMLTSFTQSSAAQSEELISDFSYLAALAKNFDDIFRNSISIGGYGEQVLTEKYQFEKRIKTISAKKSSKPSKTVEEIYETKNVEETRVCYFNVCLKMLRRNCVFKKNNCNGCSYYEKYKTNDFETFKTAVEKLFELSLKCAQWQERDRLIALGEITISHTESEQDKLRRLDVKEIEEYAKKANEVLEKLAKYAKKKKVFCVDYAPIKEICVMAEKIYCKLLGKYYGVVMDIFATVTDESKRGFELVNNSFTSARKEG